MSRLYERLCKKANHAFGLSKEEVEEKRKERHEVYIEKGKELRKAERDLRKVRIVHGKDSKGYKKAKKRLEKAEKSYQTAKRNYGHEDFKETMFFIDMDLKYEQVVLFAGVMALVSFFATIAGLCVIHFIEPLGLFDVLVYGIPSVLVIPMAVLIFTANYPEILEQRMKAESIGKAPESINYMTMAMRVKPSLYRAVSFSAENTEEPMSSGLNKVLWDVHTRKKSSLEESFVAFALRWGEWNEDLKRALYAVRSAMLERTKEGLNSALEKANEIVIEGTKRQVEDFANSLGTPTTILFAVGILLPLIIGAMLPMLALSGLDISSMDSEETVKKGGIGLAHIILLMDVLAPAGAFFYSYKILGDRPGTTSPPDIEDGNETYGVFVKASILAVIMMLPVIILSDQLSFLMPLPYFWPPVTAISYFCLKTSWDSKKKREEVIEMEREFPDALFQLGSRIAEGMPPEKALQKTSDAMQGTKVGSLFERITCFLQVNRVPLEEALFGSDGVLEDINSNTIKATMKTVVQITKKDPKEAGKTILQISDYLRSMEEMDHEIKSKLSQSVEMMKGTALVFAPVVMGVVSSLYFMLHGVFSDISSMSMISPVDFTAVVGIYLVLLSLVITYFTTGIKSQLDPVEFKYQLGIMLPVSITVFSLAVAVGKFGITGM